MLVMDKKHLNLDVHKLNNGHISKYIYWGYVAVLVGINFSRMFCNNFWGDECHSILTAKTPLPELFSKLIEDSMSPLYFLFLKMLIILLGDNPFVYHMASFIPYLVIVTFACTLFRNRFGYMASILLLTWISISQNAFIYIGEIRMYEIAGCGAVIAYLMFYEILRKESLHNYLLFALASLVAVYSHYFAVFPFIVMYLAIFVYSLVKRRKLINVLILYIGTVLGYAPWLGAVLQVANMSSENGFWITDIPKLTWAMWSYFSTNDIYSKIMILVVIICVTKIFIEAVWAKKGLSEGDFWIVSGVIASFSSLFALYFMSVLWTPCLLWKYLYPANLILYIATAAGMSRIIKNKYCLGIVSAMIIGVCAIRYLELYNLEIQNNQKCRVACETIESLIDKDDYILGNDRHYAWTIMEYYFPDLKFYTVANENEKEKEIEYELDKGEKYWAIWNCAFDEIEEEWLKNNNYTYKTIVEKGNFADTPFYMYELLSD